MNTLAVRLRLVFVGVFCLASAVGSHLNGEPMKVLIIDGQNNHAWKETTPVMKRAYEASGRFTVDVATSPPRGSSAEAMEAFQPDLSEYDAVLSNYNGQPWGQTLQEELLAYVGGGGAFVVIHAANNAFANWPEYNRLIGLGGWGNRKQDAGPYVYFKDGRLVRDAETPGSGGSHGPQHEFQIVVRDANHPITADMPPVWMHAKDELYDSLRGPALEMRVLATAYSPKSQRHEPMILTVRYGEGRIFHTPMGHSPRSMQCVGFITTLLRGTEWAITGDVTTPIPDDFPTKTATSVRD